MLVQLSHCNRRVVVKIVEGGGWVVPTGPLDAVGGLVLLVEVALGLGGAEAAELSLRVSLLFGGGSGGERGGMLTSHLLEVLQTFQPGLP